MPLNVDPQAWKAWRNTPGSESLGKPQGPTSKGISQNKSSASSVHVGASSRPPSVPHPDLPPRESGQARFPVLVAFLFHILFPLTTVTDSLVIWCFVFHAFLSNSSPCWEPLVGTPSCLAASRWLWFHSPHDPRPEPPLLQALPQVPPPALLRMAPRPPCSLPLPGAQALLLAAGLIAVPVAICLDVRYLSTRSPRGSFRRAGIAVLWVPIPGTGSGTWLMPSQCRLHERRDASELATRLWRRALAGALPRVPPPS